MIINRILDELFARKSNVSVMRALRNYKTGISGREVSRICKITPKTCLITLTHLEDIGIVTRIRGNREHIFTLNRANYFVVKAVLPLLQVEDNFWLSIKNDIKSILQKRVIAAIIFGSVVRKEETVESDLDLCLISDNITNTEKYIDTLRKQMYQNYNINISPLYFTKKDFINKAKKEIQPVTNIVKEGEVVVGKSIWRVMNA